MNLIMEKDDAIYFIYNSKNKIKVTKTTKITMHILERLETVW